MTPAEGDVATSMEDIIDIVADADKGKNSIGYSSYYYATTMYNTAFNAAQSGESDGIKLIEIDGIPPTAETIQDGTYPISIEFYIVINSSEPQNSNVRKLVEAMIGVEGQDIVEGAGYIRIK